MESAKRRRNGVSWRLDVRVKVPYNLGFICYQTERFSRDSDQYFSTDSEDVVVHTSRMQRKVG